MRTRIGEVAERVFVGLSMHGRSIALSDEQVIEQQQRGVIVRRLPCLTPSAIHGVSLCLENLEMVAVSSPGYKRYCINSGDVLAVCRGTQFRSAVVPAHAPTCLISSSLISIRLNPTALQPELLCAYLNDPSVVENLIRKANSAPGTLSISVKNIEDVALRVPHQDVQSRLCELFENVTSHHQLSTEIADVVLKKARSLVSNELGVI